MTGDVAVQSGIHQHERGRTGQQAEPGPHRATEVERLLEQLEGQR
ncbi:hypothetical protein AB0M48_45010 [Lentzea sp. NPDC051208]